MAKNTKRNISKTMAIVLFVIIIVSLLLSVVVVKEGEMATITRFQEIIRVEKEPGVSFKIPFVDEVSHYNSKIRVIDLAASDVTTMDKISMVIDTYALWQITDPHTMVTRVGNEEILLQRISATIYGNLKTITGTHTQNAILEDRIENKIDTEILERTQKTINTETLGVEIIDLQVQQFDYHETNKQTVFERMISEREQLAGTYIAEGQEEAKKIYNSTDREKEIIVSKAKSNAAKTRAEGDSEYLKIISSVYNTEEKKDFYEFLISLDALEESLTGEGVIILDKDSEISRILNNN